MQHIIATMLMANSFVDAPTVAQLDTPAGEWVSSARVTHSDDDGFRDGRCQIRRPSETSASSTA
jgi:hypothetical protein